MVNLLGVLISLESHIITPPSTLRPLLEFGGNSDETYHHRRYLRSTTSNCLYYISHLGGAYSQSLLQHDTREKKSQALLYLYNMDAPISSPSSNSSTASSQHPSPSNANMPARAPAQGPEANAYLDNFTLIAEAAKRAQVAVMVRDFEDIGIS